MCVAAAHSASAAAVATVAALLLLQERLVSRAGALLRLLRWVNSQQPDLLDSDVVQQVEALAAADDINPAVQVLPQYHRSTAT